MAILYFGSLIFALIAFGVLCLTMAYQIGRYK